MAWSSAIRTLILILDWALAIQGPSIAPRRTIVWRITMPYVSTTVVLSASSSERGIYSRILVGPHSGKAFHGTQYKRAPFYIVSREVLLVGNWHLPSSRLPKTTRFLGIWVSGLCNLD